MKRPHESLTVLFDTDYDQLLELILVEAPQFDYHPALAFPDEDTRFFIQLDECPWDYI